MGLIKAGMGALGGTLQRDRRERQVVLLIQKEMTISFLTVPVLPWLMDSV